MSFPAQQNFASVFNVHYLDRIYEQFVKNPGSVHPSWAYFFQGMEFARQAEGAQAEAGSRPFDTRIAHLIRGYRRRGHLIAKTNPLETKELASPQLDITFYGFSPKDMDKEFPTEGLLEKPAAPLRQILEVLRAIYCSTIGLEYVDLQNPEVEKWMQARVEPTLNRPQLSLEDKRSILEQLNMAELFEKFLHTKYVGQKRFSLEGAEVLIPALSDVVEVGTQLGVNEIVIGMPHRGRLNVLANILNKAYHEIFSEFEDSLTPDPGEGSGDVKYHKGFTSKIKTRQGKEMVISLGDNPSHLEATDPVILGKTRAKQDLKGDKERAKILPVLIHGDAAIAAQGVVYECFQMSKLEGYTVGGTLHIVVNNQIGFTTKPHEGRSSLYCTDVAKVVGAPVFHVNGDDPEAVVHCIRVSLEFLHKFKNDVVVDIVCYRRHGHNEGDEPAFTSPLDYKVIRDKPSVREIYRDELISRGQLEKEIAEGLEVSFQRNLGQALEEIRKAPSRPMTSVFDGVWSKFRTVTKEDLFMPVDSAVPEGLLRGLIERLTTLPSDFHALPKLERVIQERRKPLDNAEAPMDWGLGEHLAFGSLLWGGTHVRLAGQDSARGTFSQRHAVWIDCENETPFTPLKNLKEGQGRFDVYNSPLSEYAAMGFEYGYSLSYPSALVMWEAQFGDFVNGAQIILDQFFCSSEQKWRRFSGLVLLLPHGQEGQGPEHSSARIERLLGNAAQNNFQVAIPTTPAQYFHLLRRQVLREWRRPLVVGTPKGYLRQPVATSRLRDFSAGHFLEVLPDPEPASGSPCVAFCSGKVYYDIIEECRKRKLAKNFALHRLEQIYPFHREAIHNLIKASKCKKVVWIQEEPLNQGAHIFIRGRMLEVLPKGYAFDVVGRAEAASPAVGSHRMYDREVEALMDNIFKTMETG